MTEPTDAEIDALWRELFQQHQHSRRSFARAVLAKWGTPPVVAGETVAHLHDDGYWTPAKTEAGRQLNERLMFAGSPKIAVYLTPQPTQAQAGAVPLTEEQVDAAAKKLAECMDYPWNHMPEQGRAEMRKHAQAVLSAATCRPPPPTA